MSTGYRTTITEGLRRAARLVPFTTRGSASHLQGHGAYVCSPAADAHPMFRGAQEARTRHYLKTGERNAPGYAPAYVVTAYGVPIAWVDLAGRTFFADRTGLLAALDTVQWHTVRRYLTELRNAWAPGFIVDSEGRAMPREARELVETVSATR